VNEIARKENMCRSTIQKYLKKAGIVAKAQKPAQDPDQPKKKKLSEFRAMYDKSYFVPRKIQAALKKLGDGWEYEIDFCKITQVSLQDLSRVREQFAEYLVCIGRDGRRVWTGSKKVAEQMRQMV
jgi:transposase